MMIAGHSIWLWAGFHAAVFAMLAIDLGLFHRQSHEVRAREALAWSAVWVAVSLIFCAGIYRWMGHQPGLEFLTGYVIEKSLSVDNLFVFVLIFTYFNVPAKLHHRVLFWGILGALVMRGAMIALGTALIARFEWTLYVFGAFLVYAGGHMCFGGEEKVEPERNPFLKLLRRFVPMTECFEEARFFTVRSGRWMATPLLAVLVVVETTDVVFAVDSIPAIFAVTRDPFIVYTSNVCAILGLRALYFLLASVISKLRYLRYGLGVVLAFVGVKMLIEKWIHISVLWSLSAVAVILAVSVAASLSSEE